MKETFVVKLSHSLAEGIDQVESGKDVHVRFTENSKTHMYSIGLLPLITCHARCRETCGQIKPGRYLPDCYACRFCNRFVDSRERLAVNTALAMKKPDQYWEEVDQKMKCERFMRLFDSGDMIIPGYFDNLCSTLIRNPHCELQGFTKCWEIVNGWIEKNGPLPANLHLLFSGWYDSLPINPYHLPESRVYDDTLPEGWLSCGGNCQHCACVGLGCWRSREGDIVGLKKH